MAYTVKFRTNQQKHVNILTFLNFNISIQKFYSIFASRNQLKSITVNTKKDEKHLGNEHKKRRSKQI